MLRWLNQLVDIYLEFIHSDGWRVIVEAHPHFNVIPHFLAQSGSEPQTVDLSVGYRVCWEGDWGGAVNPASVWTGAHTCGADNSGSVW